MISSRPVGAAGAVRLLLLTVLLGLFGMHVLTAHGGDHHGLATVTTAASGHGAAGHHGGSPEAVTSNATAGGGMAMTVSHSAATGAGSTSPTGSDAGGALAGRWAFAAPGAPGDGAGLMACWLLLTVGAALIALLFRGRRAAGGDARAPISIGSARPGRPRAPPGRLRLHELAVLRV